VYADGKSVTQPPFSPRVTPASRCYPPDAEDAGPSPLTTVVSFPSITAGKVPLNWLGQTGFSLLACWLWRLESRWGSTEPAVKLWDPFLGGRVFGGPTLTVADRAWAKG
jgi:hypothetical protein